MEEKYYIICNSDGDTTVTEMTKPELLLAIEENYWGERVCLEDVPRNDTNYWGESILIIKGGIVTPTPKEVITSYDID